MVEPQIYIFEPEQRPAHTYILDAAGLTYRPPGHAPAVVRWDAIRYLKDIPGQKVEIVIKDSATAIPLYYATRNFAELQPAAMTVLGPIRTPSAMAAKGPTLTPAAR